MIMLTKTSVSNIENAIRGARNPMNSWDSSDSFYGEDGNYLLGENDMSLAIRLCRAVPDHRKFLRQIFVTVDIMAPLYWWKQFDTYRVGIVTNSTSTMHKIHCSPFSLDDFSTDQLDSKSMEMLTILMRFIEENRKMFIYTQDEKYWWNMIQLLPSSYNQLRTCTMNFENLVNIFGARRHHRLFEWRAFCSWIYTIDYSDLIFASVGKTT